jgi:hypothetical protein
MISFFKQLAHDFRQIIKTAKSALRIEKMSTCNQTKDEFNIFPEKLILIGI